MEGNFTTKIQLEKKHTIFFNCKNAFIIVLFLFGFGINNNTQAQVCGSNVPTFMVDLTGNPGGSYTSPFVSRLGNCCGTSSPDRCVQFVITLDSQAVAVNFQITSGAIPPGALFYQVGCGPQSPVGSFICISGVGPHILTFCKPGNNVNQFTVFSIPKPIFPADDTVRVGCSKPINVLGLAQSTVTWNSIFPGVSGQYNSLLSCTSNCTTSVFTPLASSPPFIDYVICGFPTADQCGFNTTVCDTVRIYTAPELTGSISPNPASYCPVSPGVTLTASAAGGVGPYAFQWKNNVGTVVGTGSTYFANSPGNYTVTISDALNPACPTIVIPVTVTIVNVTLTTTKTNVACNGASTGSITVNPVGGAAPYTYLWSPGGQTTQTINGLNAGSYTVTVTDAGGCTASNTTVITQPTTASVTITSPVGPGGTNIVCKGETNGTATANPTGGVSPYTYLWNTAATTQMISNLGAGFYQVTITDQNGCTATDTLSLTEPDSIVILIDSVTFASGSTIQCNGTSTGSVCVNVFGGTSPYTYNWSTGDTINCIGSQPAGTVTITVFDSNGCSKGPVPFTFTEPTAFSTSISATTYAGGYNISCNGASDGSIDLTVSGASPPYTYNWSSGQTTQDISGVPAGAYTVTITDVNSCTATDTITLTEPPTLTDSLSSPVNGGGYNIGCNGETNGELTAYPLGGTSPFSYLWSNAQTTQTISNLGAGTYIVTITDANSCMVIDSMTLTQPDSVFALITSDIVGGTNIACYGQSTGTATVQITGGSAPFTYNWSTGATTDSISGLMAGIISIYVEDINGCSAADTFAVTQPDSISTTLVTSTYNGGYSVTCNGASTGTASANVSGGTSPYSYAWSNGDTTQTITGLTAGTYYVTITDANSCVKSDSVILTEPDTLQGTMNAFAYPSGNNISCLGASDGAVGVGVTGGTDPFTYMWNTGATTDSISGLAAGMYTVTITDDNGCTSSSSVTLTEAPTFIVIDSLISPTYPGGWNVSCNAGVDGSITVYPSGGSTPYSYVWSNGDSTQTTSGVSVSIYIVTVTDVNGCTAVDSLTLTEPALLVVTGSASDALCFSSCDGSVGIASTVGGTAPYTYIWSTGDTAATVNGLCAGMYIVSVYDANGCFDEDTVFINEPTLFTMSAAVDNNVSCFAACDGQASVTSATGGTAPYTYLWSNGDTTIIASGLCANNYTVTVTDANGCSDSASVTITEPALLTIATTIDNNVTCFSACDGMASVTGTSGGTLPYSYMWSNGDTTTSISALCPGTYVVTVTDSLGCTATDSVMITEPLLLEIFAAVDSNVTCFADCDGVASVTSTTGGTLPYAYIWSNGDTTTTISGQCAGSYDVTVTDANGCTASATITITEPALLEIFATVDVDATCSGICDGQASVTGTTGGTGPFTYVWSNGDTTTTTSATLCAGPYDVTVTDANGCTASVTVTVTEPVVLTITTSIDNNASCNGVCDGQLSVTSVTGGTLPYTYVWSNGDTTATISNLCAGTYTVAVFDSNGCAAYDTLIVTEPVVLTMSAAIDNNVSCNTLCDGQASVSASAGGTLPYTYLWSNGDTTTTTSNLCAGPYTVTITDANGCSASATVTITEPAVLAIVATVDNNVSCNAECDGQATASSTTGGTSPYSYLWSNGDTTITADSLCAGSYIVTVTDANGCTATATVTITQPQPISATVSAASNVSCNGACDGSASVTNVQGGTSPYMYTWSNGMTTATITGLCPGTYVVTIDDQNGCMLMDSITITQPQTLNAAAGTVTNESCFSTCDGAIDLTPVGGTAPFTYQWSSGQTTEDLAGLCAGTYSVTITDANACTATGTYTVTQPVSLAANAGATQNICGPSTVLAGNTPPAGTGTWTVLSGSATFNNPNSPTTAVTGLTIGTNVLQWTIVNGICRDSATVTINADEPVTAQAQNDVTVCDLEYAVMATAPTVGVGMWSAPTGSPVVISNPMSLTPLITNLGQGQNFLYWTVTNGQCVEVDTVIVTLDIPANCDSIAMPTGFTPNDDGYNDTFFVIGLIRHPDNNLVVFNRWGNEIFKADGYQNDWKGTNKDGDPLPDGTYFVILKVNDLNRVLKGFVDIRRNRTN